MNDPNPTDPPSLKLRRAGYEQERHEAHMRRAADSMDRALGRAVAPRRQGEGSPDPGLPARCDSDYDPHRWLG